MNLHTLKQRLRESDYKGDSWGASMGALFDLAAVMALEGDSIPPAWGYSPGMGSPEIMDEVLGDWFEGIGTEDRQLVGLYLDRLTNTLRNAGESY